MSEQLLTWLFGGVVVWCSALSSGFILLKSSISEVRSSVTEIRIVLVTISKRAAEILHHEDDRYSIDGLLEKYIAREHELSFEEWTQLFAKTQLIMNDPSIAKNERMAAALLHDLSKLCNELSKHKLQLKPVIKV